VKYGFDKENIITELSWQHAACKRTATLLSSIALIVGPHEGWVSWVVLVMQLMPVHCMQFPEVYFWELAEPEVIISNTISKD